MLRRVADLLSKDEDIELALAFGSVAAGQPRAGSDFDVAILTRGAIDARRKRDIIAAVAAIVGRPIDLVDLRTAGVHVAGVALRTGKRLVCREPRVWAELLSRNLVDAADFLPYRERMLGERRKTWIR